MCQQQAVVKSQISLKMTLFKLNLSQNDENVCQKYFWGLINTLTAEGFLETGPFMRFGNHALRVNNLKNSSAMRFNFFQNV